MSDLEQTQAIFLDDYGEETDEDIEGEKKIVSVLKVENQTGFPKRKYPLYEGDNIIGRQEDVCDIVIPLKALSRQHACIEIRGDSHLIYDKGSLNKTKRNKLFLTPEVRYELKNKDTLVFGDVNSVYVICNEKRVTNSSSDSESEPEFQTAPEHTAVPESPDILEKSKTIPTTLVYQADEEEEEYDSDESVNMLQPTQAYTSNRNTNDNSSRIFRLGNQSDEDNEGDKKKNLKQNITVEDTPAPIRRKGKSNLTVEESGSETEGEDHSDVPTVSIDFVEDVHKDNSTEGSIFLAPTQAFVKESDDETDTEENVDKQHLMVAETQSFLESGKQRKAQTSVQDSNTDEEEAKRNVPVTEVEVNDEDETDDEDVSHLLDNPTMACDLDLQDDDDVCEAATQAFVDRNKVATSKLSNKEVGMKGNAMDIGGTVILPDEPTAPNYDDATQCFNDSTMAVTDAATLAIDMPKEQKSRLSKKPKHTVNTCDVTKKIKASDVSEMVVVGVEEDSDDVSSRLVEAETLAVTDDVKSDGETQVFDKHGDIVCDEATQIFKDKTVTSEVRSSKRNKKKKGTVDQTFVLNDETVAITADPTVAVSSEDATQVFTNATVAITEGATLAVSGEDATQVFTDATVAITEDATLAESGEDATQVFTDATVAVTEDATLAVSGEDATQVFTDATVAVTEGGTLAVGCDDATQVFTDATVAVTEDATFAVSGEDATQVFTDATVAVTEGATLAVNEDATQVFTDATVAITEGATLAVSGEDATQVFTDATVAVTEDATLAVSGEEATQVFTEDTVAVTEDATLAVSGEGATQVFTDTTLAITEDATTAANGEDATQVFTDATVALASCDESESTNVKQSTKTRGRKTKQKGKTELKTSQVNVVTHQVANITGTGKKGRNNKQKDEEVTNDVSHSASGEDASQKVKNNATLAITCEDATQVFTDATMAISDENFDNDIKPSSNRTRGRKPIIKLSEDIVAEKEVINIVKETKSDKDSAKTKRNKRKEKTEADNVREADQQETSGEGNEMVTGSEDTPPLDFPEKEEDITVSPPRRGRQRGRVSTADKVSDSMKVARKKGKSSVVNTQEIEPKSRIRKGKIIEEDPTIDVGKADSTQEIGDKSNETRAEEIDKDKGISTRGRKSRSAKASPSPSKYSGLKPPGEEENELEATQAYMEGDAEPTQIYCMDTEEIDRDENDTPPVSDVIGVAVIEGEPVTPVQLNSDEIVPTSHGSEDSNFRSPLISIPSRSPYKSALSSPEKKKNSPSPKRVMFAKRDSETSESSSETTVGRKGRRTGKSVGSEQTELVKKADSTSETARGRQGRSTGKLTSSEQTKKAVSSTETKNVKGGRSTRKSALSTHSEKIDKSEETSSTSVDDNKNQTMKRADVVEKLNVKSVKGRRSLPVKIYETTGKKTQGRRSELPFSQTQDKNDVPSTSGLRSKLKGQEKKGEAVEENEIVDESHSKRSITNIKKDRGRDKNIEVDTEITDRKSSRDINVLKGNGQSKDEVHSHKAASKELPEEVLSARTARGRRKTTLIDTGNDSQSDSKVSVNKKEGTKKGRSDSSVNLEETITKKQPSDKSDRPHRERILSVTDDKDSVKTVSNKGGKRKGKAADSVGDVKGKESDSALQISVENTPKATRGRSVTRKSMKKEKETSDLSSYSSTPSVEDSADSISMVSSKRGRRKQVTDEPTAKKAKMEAPDTPQSSKKSSHLTISSPSLRRKSMDPSKPKVMFTGVVDEQGQKIVKDLGGELVSSVFDCTHLVTDKVRRTVKFLCCLSRGIPIVTLSWLNNCKSAAMFIDSTPFLVKDPPSEKLYKFSLKNSLDKARDSLLLHSYKIHVTKSVKPEAVQMKEILLSAGAEYLTTLPKQPGDNVLVISCESDQAACQPALKADIPVVNAEFVLTGILRQEVQIQDFRIFKEKSGQKRGRDSSTDEPSRKRRK